MGEHGGCGILVVLVLLVAVLFGAGYLLATENLAAGVEAAVAARTAAEAARTAAETALAQAQAQLAASEAARAAAETTLRNNEEVLARLRQENAGLAWQAQRLAELEAETARLRDDLAAANANAAEKARLLEIETQRRVAAETELGRIPVTNGSGGGEPSIDKIAPAAWLILAAAGLGMSTAAAVAINRAACRASHAAPASQLRLAEGSGEVLVRMTRGEAREFARWKARR